MKRISLATSSRKASSVGDDAALFEMLVRCRRRACLLLALRYSTVACALALVAVAALFYLSPHGGFWFQWAAPVACAATVCMAAAFWRRPSPQQVAGEIDRRLLLEDSVVAALQVHATRAPVASLIVRNAITRAGHVEPSSVFPIQLRGPVALVGMAALLSVVIVFSGRQSATITRSVAAQVGSSGDPSSASRMANRQQQQPPHAAGEVAAAPRTKGETGRTPSDPESRSMSSADPASANRTRTSAVAPDRTVNLEPAHAPSNIGDRPPSSPVLPTARESGLSATTASIGLARNVTNSGSSFDYQDGASSKGGAGASSLGQGSGSGGVQGGALMRGGVETAPPRALATAQYAASYARARQRAEAAVSRDEVPPDLRSYVRDYFLAITPAVERE